MAEIATDEAQVQQQLAWLTAQPCVEPCPRLNLRRTALSAKAKVLAQEMEDIRRWHTAQDRLAALSDHDRTLRDAARQEPVLGRLATALNVSISTLELLSALLLAAVIEGLACLLWQLWVCDKEGYPCTTTTKESSPVTAVTDGGPATEAAKVEALGSDLVKVSTAVSEGTLRPTVANIRRFLGCAQAKASHVRKQLRTMEVPSLRPD